MNKKIWKFEFFAFLFILGWIPLLTLTNNINFSNQEENGEDSKPNSAATIGWETNGVEICTSTANKDNLKIIQDGQEGAIFLWRDRRDGSYYKLYAQKIDEHGNIQWDEDGVLVCSQNINQINPELASDGSGGAIIVWQDQRNGAYDIFAQRIDYQGNIKWATTGKAISIAADNQQYPNIINNGTTSVIIVWEDYRSGTNWDIYGQRIDDQGNIKWPGQKIITNVATLDERIPVLTSDENGGAIIAWQNTTVGHAGNTDIHAKRIDGAGNTNAGWSATGELVCNAEWSQEDMAICTDGNGGAIMIWEDFRSGWKIYAQRADASGSMQWTANGKKVCTATGSYYFPDIISDGAGGAIALWRNYTNNDYLIQRMDSNGNMLWKKNRTSINSNPLTKYGGQISSDGHKGAIVTWYDSRNGNSDIFGQRFNPDGSKNWTADGVAICTMSASQDFPVLCTDTYGDAIIAWCDNRNSGSHDDYYAQGIESNGEIVVKQDNEPTKTLNADITTYVGTTAFLNFTLDDDFGAGKYRVLVNNITGSWITWTNHQSIKFLIDTSVAGTFNHTIQYYDSTGQYGTPETVMVRIYNRNLFLEMINETFTEDVFNFTFRILDLNRAGIIGANIRFWWNGTECTGNMTELGGGLYKVNVTAIPVAPEDDPIKLNMTISKTGYSSLYFVKHVAADPETLKANSGDGNLNGREITTTEFYLGVGIVYGGSIGAIVAINLLLRKIRR